MTAKALFGRDDVKNKFKELLGKKAQGFITSVLQIVAQSDQLSTAEPYSIYQAAAVAATLDLPLNSNLGFAYIVAYNNRIKGKNGQPDRWEVVAQFQMGYKGFKQLALRSGQYKHMNETDVREGELKKNNRLTGEIEFEWIADDEERLKRSIIGYVSYFELQNGFSSTLYKTIAELKDHAMKFSQTFKKGYGLWKDDFDGMSKKTVVKLNISKNGPLSVEMQSAVVFDQAVIKNAETEDVEYIDNTFDIDACSQMINEAKTASQLEAAKHHLDTFPDLTDLYNEREGILKEEAVSQKKLEIKAGKTAAQAKIEMP